MRACICTAGGRRSGRAHVAHRRASGRRVPFIISARHTFCTNVVHKFSRGTQLDIAGPVTGRAGWALQTRRSRVLVVSVCVEPTSTRHAAARAHDTVQVILAALLAQFGARLCKVARKARIAFTVSNAL